MADDEVDVEGEFDLKTELGEEFYDANELPSKSANLLPEFTSPAWMLEQGWSLDSCIDEKSKATIEKMLLEEQQYLYGHRTSRYLGINKNVLLVTAGGSKVKSPNKSPWTQEEKNLFLRGMGIFGRSWTKIASLIPTRTSLQVKNYAQQYMKNLAKKRAEVEKTELETYKSLNDSPLLNGNACAGLASTLASVTTAQPTTVTTSLTSFTHQTQPNDRKHKKIPKEQTVKKNEKIKSTKSIKLKRSSKKKSKNILQNELLSNCDVFNPTDNQLKSELVVVASNGPRNRHVMDSSKDCDLEGKAAEGRESSTESDLDIDIDIEKVDEENPILLSRSASPSSVYEQLLRSAQVKREDSNTAESENESKSSLCDETESIDSKEVNYSPTQSNLQINDINDEKTSTEEEQSIKTEPIVNGVVSSTGELFEFDPPTEELLLARTYISEVEKRIHSDFFDGRPPKTPERYLKIRNHIVDAWLKCKPSYLNKTSVRSGLKNCGDVNCIGRVHSHLECIGAINFGCDLAVYKNPNKAVATTSNNKVKGMNRDNVAALSVVKTDSRQRKRRRRNDSGVWVDEKELEGKTIDHQTQVSSTEDKKPKGNRNLKVVYDPFKLVPCLSFSDDNKAPYEIEIVSTALAIMDIHSHISKTEVIGMLGGRYCHELSRLCISMAVPCKSMSTGMQCEMDPVSQTLASEQIEAGHLSVVGWYHSHPTFRPDPSVRDIETQEKFQYWFSKGGNHFVGVIISPYDSQNLTVYSDIRCLTIRPVHSKEYLCNLPYKFDFTVSYDDNPREILGPATELADKYSNYPNRVLLSCLYRTSTGVTCLSKMLQSVKKLLSSLENTSSTRSKLEEVLHWLEQIFLEKFTPDSMRSPGFDGIPNSGILSSSEPVTVSTLESTN